MNWINQVIEATKEAESPERFFYWAALAAISAVARKNVWINKRGLYNVYPNIYVILMARSGMRKGFPVSVAKKLVEEADVTRVVSGRNSIQAVLKEFGKPFKLNNNEIVKVAQGFMVSGEFSSFLLHDPATLTIMTELYNTHENEKEWKNSLKQAGVDRLEAPCITMLGASNEDHFRDAVPSKDIHGGFIARTHIVYEETKRRVDSLLSINGEETIPIDFTELAKHLKKIASIKGKFSLTPEAFYHYDNWYMKFGSERHDDPTGSMERMNDTILKVAMLVSLAESTDKVITFVHIKEAMEACLGCLTGVKRATLASGQSPMAHATKLILDHSITRPEGILRKQLISRGYGEYDSIDLDRVIETLLQADAILVTRQGKNDIHYKMKEQALKMYQKFKQEVN